jgi:tetratricopeptide (TPR) repeat protein
MGKLNKRIMFYIIFGSAVLLIVCGVIAANYAKNANNPSSLISLGEKHLLELDYEQALVQFLRVIEIEPMNERAYLGAAEAYIALGDAENAIAVLERGLEIMEGAALSGQYYQLLRTDDSHYAAITEEQRQLLASLFESLKSRDWAAAFDIQQSAACGNFAVSLPIDASEERRLLGYYPDDYTAVSFFQNLDEGNASSHMDIFLANDHGGNGYFVCSVYQEDHYYMNIAEFSNGQADGPFTSYSVRYNETDGESHVATITGSNQNGRAAGEIVRSTEDGQTRTYDAQGQGFDQWASWPRALLG